MPEIVDVRDRERENEIEEQNAKNEGRIEVYYGSGSDTPKTRHYNIFVFDDEDMDNEDIISKLDALPTYRRTKEDLNQIKGIKKEEQ